MTSQPIPIRSQPGIRRDGTQFDGDNYTDGLWCRFQRGLPRKMGGFRSVTALLAEKVYGMSSFSADLINFLSLGTGSFLYQAELNANTGNLSALNDRTPAGFPADPNNIWQFTNLPDAVASVSDLIAHAAPNLADIASKTETPIYFGQADLPGVLVDTGLDPVSGGVMSTGPYVLAYGNAGSIAIVGPNDPTATITLARVTGQKIVKGLPLRGGGGGPGAILWSLDTLIRGTFNPDPAVVFDFDELASDLSILSSSSPIEYDGVYYWWNVDRPMMFNGVVREVPNTMNINYFLDGLNFAQRQKVYAYKVPRFGEIWWCYPRGNATECTHAIILNVRENTWYDTELPFGGRTSGIFAQVYPKPFMADGFETATGFTLWQHETGVNSVRGSAEEPIPSSFTTSDITLLTGDQPLDKAITVGILEPDFVQVGDMTVTVSGRSNARAPDIAGDPKTFPEDNGNLPAADQIVRLKDTRRQLRFTFETNTPNGDYQAGQILAHIEQSDGRVTT